MRPRRRRSKPCRVYLATNARKRSRDERFAHTVHPDFLGPREFRRRRPSALRRIARRYQVLELALIIGGILLLWGALSLGRIHAVLQDMPGGWLG
jgi:hypothetical protein